jgi:hypothetical protein
MLSSLTSPAILGAKILPLRQGMDTLAYIYMEYGYLTIWWRRAVKKPSRKGPDPDWSQFGLGSGEEKFE